MTIFEDVIRPSKAEQKIAFKSYHSLDTMLKEIKSAEPEVEIDQKNEKIKIPKSALELLNKILKAMSEGKPVSILPVSTEFTTQAAAEYLGCSRPHFVKLLESGKIPFTKIGRHRRVQFEHLRTFKESMKEDQKKRLIYMMKSDEEDGLYGS
jgi:excisionase family DNA binding protein